MNRLLTFIVYVALATAGVIGITLSVPLQAPAVVLLGLGGLVAVVALLVCGSPIRIEGRKMLVLCLIAMAYFVLRAWFSPVKDLGIEDLMLILPAGLLYLLMAHGVPGGAGARFRQGIAVVVIALLLMHLGAALLQLGGGEGYSLSRYLSSSRAASEGRLTGMYGYYGSFANFAVIAGLLCLSLAVWGRMMVGLRLALFVIGVLALGLAVWSQSRSAVVSLVAGMVVFGVLVCISLGGQHAKLKYRARWMLALLGVVGTLVGLAGGIWVFKNRSNNANGSATDAVFDSDVRMQFWSMAAEQWADYPVVGAGSRSYSYESFHYWSPNLPTGAANPEFVHNEFLQLLCDYGLLGLLFVLALLVGHVCIGVGRVRQLTGQVGEHGMREGSNAMALSIAGVSGMIAMMVHVTFDFRTHLLANLLLLVCCAAWVMPLCKRGMSGEKGNGFKWIMASVLFAMGLSTMFIGGQQLWGGLPLLKNKMSKEDGAWYPETLSREKWIPVLEKAAERAPHFRRYQKLGALYRLESESASSMHQGDALQKAIRAYELSIERHPSNPIPHINLATIYTAAGEFEKADQAYKAASKMAKAREPWFRMHSHWAALHQQWASDLLQKNKIEEVEAHFLRAKELFKESRDYGQFDHNKRWVAEYTRLLITYALYLSSQKKYDEAERVFQEGRDQVNWFNWQTDTQLNYYYAQHLYGWGKTVWYQRKPEEAYHLMRQAKGALMNYRRAMKGNVGEPWQEQMAKIEEVLKFLQQAGIGDNRKKTDR